MVRGAWCVVRGACGRLLPRGCGGQLSSLASADAIAAMPCRVVYSLLRADRRTFGCVVSKSGPASGTGSYSTVHLAKERATETTFAVKILEKAFIMKEKKDKSVLHHAPPRAAHMHRPRERRRG